MEKLNAIKPLFCNFDSNLFYESSSIYFVFYVALRFLFNSRRENHC